MTVETAGAVHQINTEYLCACVRVCCNSRATLVVILIIVAATVAVQQQRRQQQQQQKQYIKQQKETAVVALYRWLRRPFDNSTRPRPTTKQNEARDQKKKEDGDDRTNGASSRIRSKQASK